MKVLPVKSVPFTARRSIAAAVCSHRCTLGGEGLTGHVSDFRALDGDGLQWTLLQPARGDDATSW